MARAIEDVVHSRQTTEGGGFPVRRPFPTGSLDLADPFLLLDEMGPVEWPPGEAIGAPDHPHFGFEAVTYLLDGRMRHVDSAGRSGTLGPGDVQWMTAGGGIVHAEMPTEEFRSRGGRMHGFQLWVDLPQEHRRTGPRYQEVRAADIPEAWGEGGLVQVRVIAGQALGAEAGIDTHIPITYLHVTVGPGGSGELEVPAEQAVYAYVFSGAATFGDAGAAAESGDLVVFGREGGSVVFAAAERAGGIPGPLEFLLLGGRPLDQPLARYGPFVAGSEAELREVLGAYQEGRFPLS